MVQALKGNIIYTNSSKKFEIMVNHYLIYKNNKIIGVFPELPDIYKDIKVEDLSEKIIIPGFYDLHLHSGQYLQCGVGMSKQLLDWLKDYTYDMEKKFEEDEFSENICDLFVNDLAKSGTLGSSVFATTSLKGTEKLVEKFKDKGLRSYVGLVSMERNAPDYIVTSYEKMIDDNIEFIEKFKNEDMVRPIITPRFAPTSTERGMEALGNMAKKYNLPVQSHINENKDEIEWVRKLFDNKSYSDVYDKWGLYGDTPTLMAHGIYMTDDELKLTKKKDVILVHCPDSNLNVRSGIMPVRKYLNMGIKVGLGSDIAGGHKISMTESIVRAIQLSKLNNVFNPEEEMISFSEAFYMATVVGGSFFGKIGKFNEGYEMDCLVIDVPEIYRKYYTLEDCLEKYVYTGDDRWISKRIVAGKEISVL